MELVKKIWQSKIFRITLTAALLYFAFQKVNILSLGREIVRVPWWATVGLLLYFGWVMFLGGWRWALLALNKVGLADILAFTKASYVGSFYSLFFPTSVAGDLLKWTSLLKKYPRAHKVRLAGTALIDRLIGFTVFSLEAFIALIIGKSLGYQFPSILLWLFLGINLGLVVFYSLTFLVDFPKILGKQKYLSRLAELAELLRSGNKKRLLTCLGISLVSEPAWMTSCFLIAKVFGLPLALLDVYIFMPVIALILVLPISIAGFGAREHLFLYFFGQLGLPVENILLMSTFYGILGVINSLIGGLFLWL
jgi:uncharacterized membrane protein YbhN (UPF0104 family)